MLKTNLKKNVENTSKLNRTLNKIENKFLKIDKQNANQLIKAETYANVVKTITKITKNEKKEKSVEKKSDYNKHNSDKIEKKINHKNKC